MGGWLFFAILSAVFAAITSILAKIGMQGMDSNLATAIRTVVVLIFAWGIVFMTGAQRGLSEITTRGYVFLILSGVATGLSWLAYFRALQLGEVSRVAPIDKLSVVLTMILAFLILGEQVTDKTLVGGVLITVGVVILAL